MVHALTSASGLLSSAQGMDDQALEVLKAAKCTEEVLAGKVEALAAARTEYERKQKEVRPPSAHAVNDLALPVHGVHCWGASSRTCSVIVPSTA